MSFSRPIKTPCISVCVMDDESGLCTGCARTLSEIGGWGGMNDVERDAVLRQLPQRLDKLGEKASERETALRKIERAQKAN